jgi:hypothetical protein
MKLTCGHEERRYASILFVVLIAPIVGTIS